jgi:hypothetical protein
VGGAQEKGWWLKTVSSVAVANKVAGSSAALRFAQNDGVGAGEKRTGNSKDEYRGLSTAAQKRASGRDDEGMGAGEQQVLRFFQDDNSNDGSIAGR